VLCVVPSRHQSLWSYGCSWLDRSSATVFPASFPGSSPTRAPEREKERVGGTSRRGPWERGWKFQFSLVMRREKSSGGANAWSLTSLLASLFKESLNKTTTATHAQAFGVTNYELQLTVYSTDSVGRKQLDISNTEQSPSTKTKSTRARRKLGRSYRLTSI